jgi:hypothetical protein
MSGRKNGKNGSRTHRRPTVALVNQALDEAARDAVNVHIQSGLPMVDWQDGKVVLVPAEEVEARLNTKKSRRRRS